MVRVYLQRNIQIYSIREGIQYMSVKYLKELESHSNSLANIKMSDNKTT